ncbi:hypothetical protein HanIR_Chr01g0048271 [Helianthus annuus]|nr:hypothetical protein HanIR_Chr01g0048271 [Helianthus annuus]KAJ0628592.1 hypothetical protein HanHA89_Chr01g0038171 [Helianthus annuus]KAJ0784921.1 hypothetical protein HanLR1_Chr01g0037101 [Helianthus annuus]
MQSRLLLDVVIRKSPAVFQLFTRKDEPLLVRWDTLLVLDLCFHVVDSVGALDLQGDGLTGQGLNKDLHTTTKTEDKVEG